MCDWYIELSKTRIREGGESAETAQRVLVYVLSGAMKLLHPFMPFITEEVWQALPHEGESIMISAWPEYSEKLDFAADEAAFSRIMDAIANVRVRRAEMNVPPSKKTTLYIETEYADDFRAGSEYIKQLASASDIEVGRIPEIGGMIQIITAAAKMAIPLAELVDKEKELARLGREKEAVEKDINMISGKLSNEKFVAKAPEKVVEAERVKLAAAQDKLAKIIDSIKSMS